MLLLIILDPVHCTWTKWGPWGACSASCGKGIKTRSRAISMADSHGGRKCVERLEKSTTCIIKECPGN